VREAHRLDQAGGHARAERRPGGAALGLCQGV